MQLDIYFFSYIKKRFLNKLLILYYKENNIKKTISFFKILFKESSLSKEIDLNNPYLEKYK